MNMGDAIQTVYTTYPMSPIRSMLGGYGGPTPSQPPPDATGAGYRAHGLSGPMAGSRPRPCFWSAFMVRRNRTSAQNTERKEKYLAAREAGFSRVEARQLRDVSSTRFSTAITTKKRQNRQVQYDRDRSEARERDHTRGINQAAKHQQWADWSKHKAFPNSTLDRIANINEAAGRDALSSWGFRVAYRMHVYGESYDDAVTDTYAGVYTP